MRRFGGFHPSPWNSRNEIEPLANSYLESLGTAYAQDGYVATEANAYARAIFEARIQAQQLANIWNPLSTPFLSEWEGIFGLTKNRLLTEQTRRAQLLLAFQAIGTPAAVSFVESGLRTIMGACYLSLSRVTQAQSVADGTAMILGGLDLTPIGGANFPDGNEEDQASSTDFHQQWGNKNTFTSVLATSLVGRSQVAHLTVNYSQQPTQSDSDLFTVIDSARTFLDKILPAQMTFDFVAAGDPFATDTTPNMDQAPLGP